MLSASLRLEGDNISQTWRFIYPAARPGDRQVSSSAVDSARVPSRMDPPGIRRMATERVRAGLSVGAAARSKGGGGRCKAAAAGGGTWGAAWGGPPHCRGTRIS